MNEKHVQSVAAPELSIGSSKIRCIDSLYSLNDLHKASGSKARNKPVLFLRLEQTKSLIDEISKGTDMYLSTKLGSQGGTYACKELVIAYAAWISPTFHLKVIQVFLENQKPAVPEIDVKALLLENHYKLAANVPAELLNAIDKKAWEMAGEAYALFQDYLKRHIATCQYGDASQYIYINNAMEVINKTSIGNALAHTYYSEIDGVERAVSFALYKAEKALRKIRVAKSGQDVCHE